MRIIEEPNTESSASPWHPSEPVLTPISLNLPLQRDPPAELGVNHAVATEESSRERAEPAPVGLYLERINEFIDRAWFRPQIAIGAREFSCRVRIDQTPSGQIENVAVEECDPNVRWRLSLLSAIRSASPLPTPTDPSQFRSTLHIVLKSKSKSDEG